jgi:carbon monoxide dehydrogenase subunit G
MAVFHGAYEETFTVDVPLEKAKAHFGKLELIGKNYDGVDRWEKVDDCTLRIMLKPQDALGVSFRGEHVCKYVFGDRETTWKSEPGGNMRSHGRTTFEPVGEGRTRITHRDEIECDIEINRFLAKALQPVVGLGIERGVKAYLARMRKAL